MLYDLIHFDARTMIGILFWGNLTSAGLIFSYQSICRSGYDRENVTLLYVSRLIKSVYYLLIFYRGMVPDIVSVNLGNLLMFISLYMDGYLLLRISGVASKLPYRFLQGILAGSVILFNFVDLYFHNLDLRVSLVSLLMFAILLMPSVATILSRKSSRFAKIVGVFYTAFLIIVLTRALYSLIVEPIHIFTDNILHSLTFISLTFIMIFSAPALLLIMKEKTETFIQKMADTDELTSIPNRQFFFRAAPECFEKCMIAEMNIALLFLDIDFFKKVNDNYGHSFGDEVLVAFAGIVKRNMRAYDLSCRYGGEEFLALLPECDERRGVTVGERIMKEISELRFDKHPEFRFTVSIGVCAGIPVAGDTLPSYINKADSALYEAKNTGRNKIAIYQVE